jgi:hypothetical protein
MNIGFSRGFRHADDYLSKTKLGNTIGAAESKTSRTKKKKYGSLFYKVLVATVNDGRFTAVFLPLTLLRQAERSVNTSRQGEIYRSERRVRDHRPDQSPRPGLHARVDCFRTIRTAFERQQDTHVPLRNRAISANASYEDPLIAKHWCGRKHQTGLRSVGVWAVVEVAMLVQAGRGYCHGCSAGAPPCRVENGSRKKNAARRNKGWRFGLY